MCAGRLQRRETFDLGSNCLGTEDFARTRQRLHAGRHIDSVPKRIQLALLAYLQGRNQHLAARQTNAKLRGNPVARQQVPALRCVRLLDGQSGPGGTKCSVLDRHRGTEDCKQTVASKIDEVPALGLEDCHGAFQDLLEKEEGFLSTKFVGQRSRPD